MSEKPVDRPLWRCAKCDYAWFSKNGRRPERCMNPRCRSRKWNIRAELPPAPALQEVPPLKAGDTLEMANGSSITLTHSPKGEKFVGQGD